MQSKHKETLTPWLQDFVQTASSKPLPLLPQFLATFPSRWPFPRGDLYHWIPLLNRFDTILESFCSTYKLNDAPQMRDFGCDVLLASGTIDQQWDMTKLSALGYREDGDSHLVVSVLKFTQMLLDHCGNRSIYASSPHLNDLLHSTDWAVINAALRVGLELAQRYQASVKRTGVNNRQVSSALLSNHYNIDLDRVQQLAQPFVKTPILKTSEPLLLATPASSANKGKEKSTLKNAASMYANDLCAIAKPSSSDNDVRWNGWGDVRFSYYPTSSSSQPSERQTLPDRGSSSVPSTPTPLRRSSTSNAPQSTPRPGRQAGTDDSPSSIRSPAVVNSEHTSPGQKSLEIPQSAVTSTPIYKLIERMPSDLPKGSKYEFLHRLRVAKALPGSLESRQDALKARLLAIQNLAYIHTEFTFIEKVLRQDHDEPRRFQLVYQLAELIHPSIDGSSDVPIGLQAIALSLLEAMSGFHTRVPDIFSALNATVNHGVLLYVIRKAVAGMRRNDSGEQWTEDDEWRDNLFSLTLHITMAMHNSSSRNTPEIISAGLLDIMVEVLTIRSNIAERTYATLVTFLDSLIYNVQTSFQTLINADGLNAITDLITHEVSLAQKLVVEGKGTPASCRSQVVDYEIPFYQQQNLKWLLKFIHHSMSTAFPFGANTDRLLRNLVDKSALLRSLREIIMDVDKFGSLVWTQAVTILSDFLNNDPTSYAAISEAGLVQSFLEAVTGNPMTVESSAAAESTHDDNRDEGDNSDSPNHDSPIPSILDSDDRPHPPTIEMLDAARNRPLAKGIRPASDAIAIVPNVLNAISLNNQGMKMVVSSRALDSFFEIFESPEHVRVMQVDIDVAANVGASVDELARHHPSLRPSISNAVLDIIFRMAHLGRVKAKESGWGTKLLLQDAGGNEIVADSTLLQSSEKDNGKGKAVASAQEDMDVDMADADTTKSPPADPNSEEKEVASLPSRSIGGYVFSFASFLANYIANLQLKQALIQQGGIEHLLDLCTSPSLPYDFGETLAARTLHGVISQLVEASPIIGLPSLLKRTQEAVDLLQPVINASGPASYFDRFLKTDMDLTAVSQDDLGQLANGTSIAKALLNVQCLLRTLHQCFPFSSRSNNISLHPVNVFDYYDRLVRSLGPLLRCAITQELTLGRAVPEHWTRKATGSPDRLARLLNNTPTADNVDVAGQDDDEASVIINSAVLFKAPGEGSPSKAEQSSPRYRNWQTLKLLLHSLMPVTFPLLQTLGRALLYRRNNTDRDTYTRPQHVKLAESLAETILAQLELPEQHAHHLNYCIIMLHTVHELLLDRKADNRHSERTGTQIIAPVLIAFKQSGGLDVLNSMLRVFSKEICKDHAEGEDGIMSRLAVIAMKKILDMYTVFVNGKVINDSVTPLYLRPTDRRGPDNVGPNLVVELRLAILPVMRELWDSPLAEKVSPTILVKIVEILKAIAIPDHEANAYKRSDKNPPKLLNFPHSPFNWATAAGLISQLTQNGYDRDLAHEAVFRSFSSNQVATEYAKAHKSGIAGSRNPIPEDESPLKYDSEAQEGQSQPGPQSLSIDPMNLDLQPDVAGLVAGIIDDEIPGESRDAASLASGQDTPNPPPALQDASRTISTSTSPARGPSTASAAGSSDNIVSIPKEDLDAERVKLRKDLIDRCLDVVRAHTQSSYEISELILAVVSRPVPEDNSSSKQEIGQTVVNALLSLGYDEDIKPNGQTIAAYAHLLSLLVQDKGIFALTLPLLRENIAELLNFLRLPSPSSEELPPWIPYILLVFEILLSDDEQPSDIRWKTPSNEDDVMEPLQWPSKDLVVKETERRTLLEAILEILPRIGKEEPLAVSVLRILVVMTRNRNTAHLIGDKKNLQRLFVMTKQLSGSVSTRPNASRISGYALTILRHIIEDEDIIKQLMRSEIRTFFDNSRSHRQIEIATYLRTLSHVALRDPRLFVEVSNETIRLTRWNFSDSGSNSHRLGVTLKEEKPEAAKDDVAPAVRATEDLSIQDVKPSTEGEDKQMAYATKPTVVDQKRPILENSDGVIQFLLSELLNYKEVDDKEPPQVPKDTKEADESVPVNMSNSSTESSENRPSESKDKKSSKPSFKADEHPIFIYRCFLLRCLRELLQSYNRTKIEFITYKRSAPLLTNTPLKPRTSVLNYLLTDLLCPNHIDGTADSLSDKKKSATANQVQTLLVALVSKTGEKPLDRSREKYDYDEEPDLLFVRKFVLDTILKAYKDASSSTESFEVRYSRMLALAEVMHQMMGEKDKDLAVTTRGNMDQSSERSHSQMRRLMYEKGYLGALTASIADIDLAYPPVKKTIKYILRVLRILTSIAIQLSHANILPAASTLENVEDDIASATSLSDMEDDREETPDLYRNSALGMLEPGRDMEEDYSEESGDDDAEMYDEEYPDEMDYDEEVSVDGEENVSDEDDEDDVHGMGHIEGLPGGVVEVTMEDEDEDDDEDDMDEDDDEGSDEDDDIEDAMDDMDDDIEERIEIVDDEGNPVDDDGASGWESDTDEEDDDGDEVDYEAEAQEIAEAAAHGLDDVDGLGRFNIMHPMDDDYDGVDDINNMNNPYLEDEDEDEEDDDEDDVDEDDFAFEGHLNDAPPPNIGLPSMGWDTLVLDHGGNVLGGHHHHRHHRGIRSPFPPVPFMMGGSRDSLTHFGDMRNFMRPQRSERPNGNDDGQNPLLRPNNGGRRDASPRPNPANSLIRLFGNVPGESPLAIINELITSMPSITSRGQNSLHFQISHGSGAIHELSLPLPPYEREPTSNTRRDTYQEPSQAASFSTESTMTRWQEEAKMIHGGTGHVEKAGRLLQALLAYLVPPAIQREKEAKAVEAELKRHQEEERKKREEEERKAKEAEEKAAREKAEAEAREREAAAAAEIAASAGTESTDNNGHQQDEDQETTQAMEGVETSEGATAAPNQPAANQPRVVTTIRGEEVDVTELGIDPDYLEALPEEFREEVIAQTISQRRSQAREAPRGSGEQTEVFQEFLDALPEELRQEIVQQERAEQRRRERDEARRQNAAANGQEVAAQDMDPASILLTFPPALREQVLMDQGADIMDSLPPDMAAEARRLVRRDNAHVLHGGNRIPSGTGRSQDAAQASGNAVVDSKPQRKTVVQMLDKPGVATLLRLMFINVTGGSIESSLKHVFKDVCQNKQTRLEVVSTLLQILQDGTTDVDAVERSFAQLSIKAKQPKDKDGKTPQSLKRTFTNISTSNPVHTSSETSPVLIVQQCLDLLCFLADQDVHVPALFLTEHETVGSNLKRSLSRKGKGKDTKSHKFAINSLLALLDRDLVTESSAIMDSLSLVLSRVTYPLLQLDRKLKEADETIKQLDKQIEELEKGKADAVVIEKESGNEPSGSSTKADETPASASSAAEASTSQAPAVAKGCTAEESTESKVAKLRERKQSIEKRVKTYNPPVIPVHNLTSIINIFVARECSSKTFKETLSAIKNLSVIPGAMDVFGQELARQARLLSEKIVGHLDGLLPHIEKASSGTEIQGVALAKFSPGAADQNKLLRVLTALDHLFAQKKSHTSEESEEPSNETKKQDLLATLYRNSTFNTLWERLSACLSAIRQRESLINVATILLPLIEALMVVCKDTASESPSVQSQSSKEMFLSSPQPESRMATLFFTFTEDHRRILNELVRNNPSLMKGTFAHLVKNPKVLEFDNKRNWFNRSVHNRSQLPSGRNYPSLQLQVRREQVFHDSFRSLYFKSGDEMKFGKLNIRFHGEEGVDAGGVTREWFQVLSRQMFDPNYALFVPVSSDRTTFHPNKLSGVNEEHLMFFKFIGRIIGKALYEGRVLDCYFSRAVYKRILGKPVSVKDMESFDPDYYKSLVWMLENDITDIITETFSVEDDEFGVTKIEDLVENGRNIPVTEDNKHDYVRLVVEHKLLKSVREQMENFLKGFHEIIPAELISIFNEQELELLISGLPEIDIDDWKSNTEYHNYTPSSQQIQWFWRALRSFDKEERAKLLQFVTGTSKVPLNGFKELEGMNGVNRFNIHRDYGNKDRLPSSHTCFNQLDLPEYESYDALRQQLLKAITAGSDYFGFA